MKIKTVSMQWMAGRTSPNMEECTIIWLHSPERLAPGGGVGLPVCTHFTYDDHIPNTLPNFRIPKLDTLVVRNEAWNNPKGSTQLAAVWNRAGQMVPLKPRVLYLDTQCHYKYLIKALSMLPELEELHLSAPIHRLPVEMLAEIFVLSIFRDTHSPLELMRVRRSWRGVVLTMPRIWSNPCLLYLDQDGESRVDSGEE